MIRLLGRWLVLTVAFTFLWELLRAAVYTLGQDARS